MTEDDNLLLKLKDEEGLPWKAIAQKFRDMNRGEFRVPTLQMRYKRLKEKMRIWDVEDVGRVPQPPTDDWIFESFPDIKPDH